MDELVNLHAGWEWMNCSIRTRVENCWIGQIARTIEGSTICFGRVHCIGVRGHMMNKPLRSAPMASRRPPGALRWREINKLCLAKFFLQLQYQINCFYCAVSDSSVFKTYSIMIHGLLPDFEFVTWHKKLDIQLRISQFPVVPSIPRLPHHAPSPSPFPVSHTVQRFLLASTMQIISAINLSAIRVNAMRSHRSSILCVLPIRSTTQLCELISCCPTISTKLNYAN